MGVSWAISFFILIYWSQCCLSWNHDEDYVDFTDMGSYNHGFQRNKNAHNIPGLKSIEVEEIEAIVTTTKPQQNACTLDDTSSITFLKRIVSSLLRQMNVRGHIFGPGEAITIDLQAEISHEDFTTLNKFVGASDGAGAKYLTQVDSILSNLIHIVEPPLAPNFFETYKEGLINLFTVFLTPQIVLLFFSMAVVVFLVVLLAFKTRYAPTVFHIVTYGFLIIFVLSCVWNFVSMYEDAKAQSYARLMQTRDAPTDCEFDRMGYWDSVKYFVRVKVFKYEDRCVAYHQEIMVEPFYRVLPTEAVSQTFATLIFHPGGYIGTKVGQFLVNASAVFPFWMQPLVVLFLFIFIFMGLFRFRVRTPLFSIEPAGYSNSRRCCQQQQEGNNMLPQSEDTQHQQLAEKPAAEVVKVNTRDVSTDTSDFEEYIRLTSRRKSDRGEQPEVRELPQTSQSRFSWFGRFSFIFIAVSSLYEVILLILDKSLRQVPFTVDQVHGRSVSSDFAIP